VRRMTASDRFLQRLFPSSKVLCANSHVAMRNYDTWEWVYPCFNGSMNLTDHHSHSQLFAKIEEKGIYDTVKKEWTGCPDFSLEWNQSTENNMATFLNSIVDECYTLLGPSVGRPRRWTAEYSTVALLGHEVKGKPDLVLLDDNKVADWRCVRSIGEMKSSSSTAMHNNMFAQLAGKLCCDHIYLGSS
jgi:hypothetical protein